MDAERAFSDLGIDAIRGVELMDQLGLSVEELQIPQRFLRLKEVLGYFKQFSRDTQHFLINKATRGKMVDKLDHVFEYTRLLEKKNHFEQSLGDIQKESKVVAGDELLSANLAQRELEVRQRLLQVGEELSLFEK